MNGNQCIINRRDQVYRRVPYTIPQKKIASAVGNVRGQRPISGLAVTCVSNVGTERSCPSVPVCLRADAMCERMPGAYNVLVREPLVSSRKRWPCKLTLIDQKHIPVPFNGTGKRNSRNGCGRFWLENAKKRVCRSRSARTTHICGCCAWPSWFSLVHPGTIAGGARRRCCHHGTGRRRRA